MKIILNVTGIQNHRHLEMAEASLFMTVCLSASPRLFCVVLGHICLHCSSKINVIELTETNPKSEQKYELDF